MRSQITPKLLLKRLQILSFIFNKVKLSEGL
jgi:hypothetical protein